MKAPDKVFSSVVMLNGERILYVRKEKDNVMYIRKDALLEWLEEELQNGGPTTLVQHIINKLNNF